MSRYNTATGIEGEYQPGSRGRVLRNIPGITSKRELDRQEYSSLVLAQAEWSRRLANISSLTCEHICKMHIDWLGGLYVWAGRYRTVELSKGGFTWPPAFRVAENMARYETNVLSKVDPYTATDPLFLAKIHAEFLLIHPFRDGNGRMARWITAAIAYNSGVDWINFGLTGRGARKNRLEYLNAVILGYQQEYNALADYLRQRMR